MRINNFLRRPFLGKVFTATMADPVMSTHFQRSSTPNSRSERHRRARAVDKVWRLSQQAAKRLEDRSKNTEI